MKDALTARFYKHRSSIRLLARVAVGSLLLMTVKIGLVEGILYLTKGQVWWIYGVVTILMTFVGWTYHSHISFKKPLSRRTFSRHFQQAVIFKILDYVIVNGCVYTLNLSPTIVIIATSGVLFVLRTLVFTQYVFKKSES